MPSGDFEWKKGAPRAGRASISASFAPTHTRLLSVRLSKSGAALERKSCDVWCCQVDDARPPLRFALEWEGERPQLNVVVVVPADEDGTGESQLLTLEATRYLELLESRAAKRFSTYARERRFFLRFDAWTSVPIISLLRDPGFTSKLSARAKSLFLGPWSSAFPFPDRMGLLHDLAAFLMSSARTRAELLMTGNRGGLAKEQADSPWPQGAPPREEAFERLATYLDALFWKHWPVERKAKPGAAEPGKAETQDLARAFALFATGALAFVPAKEKKPWLASLNAEPDSAYFFLFAEFALQAAEKIGGEQGVRWRELARTFVGLEDVFVATYGPKMGRRDLDDRYLRQHRSKRQPFLLVAVLSHLKEFGGKADDPALLQRLTLIHEINVLHAGRDEAVEGYDFGGPPPPPGAGGPIRPGMRPTPRRPVERESDEGT